MRLTHRLYALSRRWIGLGICLVLVVSTLASTSSVSGFIPQGRANQPNNGKAKRVRATPPIPGAPAVQLPNLDDTRQRLQPIVGPTQERLSSVRSRRKPLESRNGRKVGDSLPRSTPSPTPMPSATPRRSPSPSVSSIRDLEPILSTFVASAFLPESFLRKWRVRAFDHPSLKFLNLQFVQPLSIIESRSVQLSQNYEFDFDFLSPSVPQSGSSKIAFASNREGSMQIYSVNADGTGQVRLTNSGANDDYPRWSPNGAKILFQSDRDNAESGYRDVYVMNADGSGVSRLTNDANDDSMASWSPDGSKIVFQSLRNGVNYQVYSMNADGSAQVNLTNTSASDGEPSWSPNGSKIAFASDRDHAGYYSVYVMNSNGTGQQRLTFSASTVDDRQTAWSPNGSKIAFVSTRDSVLEQWQETDDFEIPEDDGQVVTKSRLQINKEVYVMNSDGSGQTRLTNELTNDESPSWSPDGSKIVFRSDRERDCCDPSSQVWTMNGDGTNQTNVSNSGNGDYTASWATGSGNQSPVANPGGTYSGTLSQNVPFNGGNSYDPDGSIVSYSWSFGDGGTSSGVAPTHAYSGVGTYTVSLTVTDNVGAQGSASTTVSITSSSSDQFVVNFLQQGMGRAPNGNETSYWTDIMRSAYPQGQPSMLMAMTEFGMTVFESAEYAARGHNNHDYVYDLYETYLMRYPDQEGWNFWTSVCNAYGRAAVRNAFEESTEFHNIVATLSASGNPSSAVSSLATARVDLFNQSGNQIQARDCEWSVPLLSLPGRAGMNLGLGVSYSSLVWTRSGPYAYFDTDNGSLSPGFSIGFPSVSPRSFDARTARNVYVFTASGRHIELRQIGTTNVYEAADSSYLQLIDYGSSLLVRSTDGTQLSYSALANGWQANQIKDRNGNLLVVNNDWRGDIQNITDTLGRVIRFNYDSNANLTSITQDGWSQPWATFGWSSVTLQPSLSLQIVGVNSGEVIPALTQVNLIDGSHYNFEYTTNAQVNLIRRNTSDNVQRAYIAYDYQGIDDCPRITAQRVSAENWTGTATIPAAEVTTSFSDNGNGSHQMITPDGTIYKEFYGTGWQHGLVTSTQVLSNSVQQKLTITSWWQADQNVNYQINPRVAETNVYDAENNRRRTTFDYSVASYAQYGLPYFVSEYAANGPEIRRSYIDYNLSQAYLDQRIIGIVSARQVYDPVTGQWQAKTTYTYDSTSINSQATTAPGHDQSYHSSFAARGNVTATSRWDADDIGNANKALTMLMSYDAAGSLLSTTDPAGHSSSIGYTDSFSDGNNSRGTFAYPTTLTDADTNSSTVQYDFSLGAKTRVQGPPPDNQPNGIIQTFNYDSTARLQQVTTLNNNAYTRYAYGAYYTQSFSSVNNVADDAYSIQVFDGLGRVFESASYHPGSSGGYKAISYVYDAMGRLAKQSNPTEINGSWVPYGDDAAGWVYTQQTYDWKGRVLETRHLTDGSVTYANYEGCGCAGSEVVTLTDEVGRQQKFFTDALGRHLKTEVLNWDGTVYAASTNTFNARDQVTLTRQYQGAEGSGVYQDTTMSYDGYGRLATKHVPEQNVGAATVYAYNSDDMISSVTDARGASTTYGYNNNRHLVNTITYSAPSGITPTSNVTFGYDAAGNRTSMIDGSGSLSYFYDQMSRMSSETKTFSGLGGSFTLSYAYNLANEVTSVADQRSGASFSNIYDNLGRVISVSGVGYGGVVTPFASQMQYRASGALKSVSYGNNTNLSLGYNERMLVTSYFEAAVGTTYQYWADGRLKFAHDQSNNPEAIKDRAFQYDHAERLAEAYSGAQARDFVNNSNSGIVDGPFRQTFTYDAWDNVTSDSGRFWSRPTTTTSSYNSANRNTAWSYDADGNVTSRNDGTTIFQPAQYAYNAAGQAVSAAQSSTYYDGGWVNHVTSNSQTYDGDGQLAQNASILNKYVNGSLQNTVSNIAYEVRSTVLGGVVISEFNDQGTWKRTYVYAGSQRVGQVTKGEAGSALSIWRHVDPVSGDELNTVANGQWFGRTVFNAQGVNVGDNDPFPPDGSGDPDGIIVSETPIGKPASAGLLPVESGGVRCVLDGIEMDCGFVRGWSTQQCPDNDCGPRVDKDGHLTQPVQAFADGWYGNLPQGAIYEGNGRWFIYGGNRDSSLGKRRKERPEDGHYGLRRNHSTPQSPTPSPTPCPGSIPEAIGKQILAVASQEKIDPTLLSVAMRHESSFGMNTKANPRYVGKGRNRRIEGYDVGPMQLATNIWNKSPFTDGLSNPFGTIGFNIAQNQYDSFNGNFEENITVAARAFALDILPRSSSNADAAGKYRGPAGYQGRYNQYVSEAPADRKQLNCIAGRK